MRKPEQSPEPSIEEILSSIRRIIADDGAPAKGSVADFPRNSGGAPRTAATATQEPAPRAQPPATPDAHGDEEILELTDDFLIEEPAPARPEKTQPTHAAPRDHATAAPIPDVRARDLFAISDDASDLGLQTVLSNVAAEVERLASGDVGPTPEIGLFSGKPDRNADIPPEPAPSEANPSTENFSDLPPQPAPHRQHSERPRMHSRPVWSARRLDSDSAPAPGAHAEASAPPPADEQDRPRQARSDRDPWAEGVQMPVPDTGPEMPFPYASEAEAEAGLAPPVADAGIETDVGDESADSEQEKGFVGDFLTRVFGSSTQRQEEDEARENQEAAAEAGRKEKAERLAKSTVAEFASDKLGAPVVADALHADKPFMDQITDSLESALAEAESMEELSEPEDASSALAAANLASHEELPEPLPPEGEFIPYGDFEEDEPEFAPPAEQAASPAQRNVEPAPASREPAFDPIAASSGVDGHPDPMFAERGPVRADPAKSRKAPPPQDVWRSDARPDAGHVAPQEPPQQPGYDIAPIVGPQTPTTVPGALPQGLQLPSGIEDSIKEMLKPLIVQWLNENLARIVEQAVREELAERRDGFPELRAGGGH
ncbi:MAG: DUF2497 domain-containing protein [Rhodomicrobiaceae bacterium]